jgi:superfamily II DNA or RNA helicase
MTATLKLRDYQREALDSLRTAWGIGQILRAAVVLPTGLGKTVIFAELCREAVREGRKPVILVHREELAQQAADKLRTVDPTLTVGIVKAERDELDADVLVCSVPTLARSPRIERVVRSLPPADRRLIVVDECHHSAAATWVRVLRDLGSFTAAPTAGFTATLSREDSKHLGDVWEKVVYTRDILYGIRRGFLTDVRGLQITVEDLDLSTVAKSRGDYQEGALGEAMLRSDAGTIIADAVKEHAPDRPSVLFAPTVQTTKVFAEDLNEAGVRTEVITGETPNDERRAIFKRHATGETQVLSNCMVLTEGWDAPHTSCAIIARPTQASGLYVQMVGRVLRPFPGKPDALVLDVVGVTNRHALATIATLTKSKVVVEDGETLAEAAARAEAEQKAIEQGKPADAVRAAGELAAIEVDLFHGSSSVWLQTYAGTWFIPTKDWTFFLWPQNGSGLWNLGRKPTWRNRQAGRGGWIREGLEIGYAMAIGEAEAAEVDPSVSQKSASWRRKSNKPSDAQLEQVARYSLPYVEGMNKSEVSDLISIHYASRDLDPKRKPTRP